MKPQQQVQEIEQCIQDCKGIISDLQSLTQKSNDTHLQSTLIESVHHLEMCIHECKYATQATS